MSSLGIYHKQRKSQDTVLLLSNWGIEMGYIAEDYMWLENEESIKVKIEFNV